MGSLTSRTTKCEGGSPNLRQTFRDDAPEMVVPRTPDDSVFDEHPPVFRRLETFEEKFYRKVWRSDFFLLRIETRPDRGRHIE